MTKTIAIVNQKGGVAKTTTALALGHGLAASGKKILLIDFDPQGSLTTFLGYDTSDVPTAIEWLGVQRKHVAAFDDVVLNVNANLDLIPSDISLEEAPGYLYSKPGGHGYLLAVISEIKDRYDYVIIDTSPSLNILTINALVAADELIVPFKPEVGSVKGISLLLDTIRDVRALNRSIRIAGFVVVMADKRRKQALKENVDYIQGVARENGTKVYNSMIRASASATRLTKEDLFTRGTAASDDYAAFVQEYLKGENKQ